MTRFLHLTDLHLTIPEQGTPDTARLDRALGLVAQLDPAPEFVVISGDLTDFGDAASYELLAGRLAQLDLPVVMTLGNHDQRPGWHGVFPGHPAAPDGPVDCETVLAGLHVIALDSSIPGRVSGTLTDAQLDWAERVLAQRPDLPKLVVLHHPPLLDAANTLGWAALDAQATERLGDLLAGHEVAAVLAGHVHLNRVALWRGVPLVINTGLDSSIDAARADALVVTQGAGAALCDLLPSGLQVTLLDMDAPPVIKELPMAQVRGFS